MKEWKKSQTTYSIFKDGNQETTTQAYTAAWIKLINLLERNKHG